MRSFKSAAFLVALFSFLSGALAQAATVSGTVTNKTTSKPSAGDKVELVDVQAGMSVAANATTNASGHYSLNKPGSGPYLVRVIHQGSPYFIAAPDGNGPADIGVYDAAKDVGAVRIEADVLEVEADNGKLSVNERYFVHNTSSPPRTQYNPDHGFEIVLPPDAVVDGTAARRPSGLPTSTSLKPASEKNHFTFDFPIQPDEGDKDTLFQITYHLPYSSGQFTFKPQVTMPADNMAFLLPKSIAFKGPGFTSVQQDPGIQTWLAKNVQPGQEMSAGVSGTGSMPREDQAQQPAANTGSQDTSNPGTGPGGGIGQPINTPDPLTKYKWGILAGLALALAAAAGFLLRKPAGAAAGAAPVSVPSPAAYPTAPPRRTRAVAPAPAHETPTELSCREAIVNMLLEVSVNEQDISPSSAVERAVAVLNTLRGSSPSDLILKVAREVLHDQKLEWLEFPNEMAVTNVLEDFLNRISDLHFDRFHVAGHHRIGVVCVGVAHHRDLSGAVDLIGHTRPGGGISYALIRKDNLTYRVAFHTSERRYKSDAKAVYASQPATPQSHNSTLLAVLKEEMFAIESEKLSGTLSAVDYKEQKSALEVVLKRALKKQGS